MLVIKLYIQDLTESELQAVLLGALSTVAGQLYLNANPHLLRVSFSLNSCHFTGSVFAAYASFGVNPGYLVTASLMSAPAALGLSKLLYPETEVSKTTVDTIKIDSSYKYVASSTRTQFMVKILINIITLFLARRQKYKGVISAGCAGALSAVNIVQNIIASLIALISLVAFGNGILSWLGTMVGYENLTIEVSK